MYKTVGENKSFTSNEMVFGDRDQKNEKEEALSNRFTWNAP